jgi:hypothetical protein
MVAKSFGDCTLAWLSKTFKLKRLLKSPDLEAWLDTPLWGCFLGKIEMS